jgi:hypothetical protein
MDSIRITGVGVVAFALQLLIVGFLLRSLTAWLLRRDPESASGKALAFIL